MSSIDISKYRKELVDIADLICSFLSEEEKKALEVTADEETISFRDQIVITYYNKYPMHSIEKTKEMVKMAIEEFRPYFKLKDDDCGINEVLLNKFDNLILESEEGYWSGIQKQFKDAVIKSRFKQSWFRS